MNKKSRKITGLSHRLIALLLCCACLFAATPISAVALETDTAVTGTFSEEPTEKITVEPEITVQPATTVALGDTVNPNTTTLGDTTSSDDVTTSDGTTTNPEDTGTTETDGVAGGTNTDPDGTSTTNPDSTTTPDGTGTTDLDGTTTNSEGTADGTTTNPEGTAGNTTTPVEYTIAFESGVADATGEAPQNVSVTQGGSVTFPDNTFTRTGYAFAGWREKGVADGTIYPAGSSEFVPNTDTTFEAVWKQVYIVTFDTKVNGMPQESITAANGDQINLPNLTKNGYRFLGWKEQTEVDDPSAQIYHSTYTVTKAVTLVAVREVAPVGEGAQVYYLKTPTSNPDSNEKDQWGRHIGNGTVDTRGATWTGDRNIFNPGAYVTGMPEGFEGQLDGSWYMPNSGAYIKDYDTIFAAYEAELEQDLGVTLTQADIEAIYLTPYKISRNNSSYPDKHIDCTINVKAKNVYAAKFWVKLPNGEMKLADAKNYKTSDSVNKTSKAPTGADGDYPNTIVVQGGITYRFDGWYNETDELVAENSWGYKPSDTELSDGTVNFYARYVRADAQLTIQKTVSGNMYDANKAFTFTVTYGGKTETFNLKKDETGTIPNVPAGATVTVTENPDGYTYSFVSITEGVTKTDQKNGVSFTMPANDVTVVINNDKTVQIDTGILLDTLPYLLILGVVAVGAVLMFKKRRNRDDD